MLAWCGFGVCVRGKKKNGRDMGGTAVRGGKSEERLKGNINSKKHSGDDVAIAEGKKGEVKQGSRQEESQEKHGAWVWFGLLLWGAQGSSTGQWSQPGAQGAFGQCSHRV